MSSDQLEEKVKPNRAMRRQARRKAGKPIQYICGTCNQPFIGASRCQCKPAIKMRQMEIA